MQKTNWDGVQEAQEFEKPAPGAYIARIVSVEENNEKEYWLVSWDFAEGQFKGYYADLEASMGFWGGRFVRSFKQKALPFFKAFKTCLEASNRGFALDETNPNCIVGKLIGVVLGEEEYVGNGGAVKVRTYVDKTHTVKAIQAGDFKVPPLKKLAATTNTTPDAPVYPTDDDGELPF